MKQNNFTETKHCFAFVLFQFYFRCNHRFTHKRLSAVLVVTPPVQHTHSRDDDSDDDAFVCCCVGGVLNSKCTCVSLTVISLLEHSTEVQDLVVP